jgi:hypothetical protein
MKIFKFQGNLPFEQEKSPMERHTLLSGLRK